MLLLACGADITNASSQDNSSCLYEPIHPISVSSSGDDFRSSSKLNGKKWNARRDTEDYYLNIDSTICDLISLNLVMHYYHSFIDDNAIGDLNNILEDLRKSSPLYESLPAINKDAEASLLLENRLSFNGLEVSIVETNSNAILIVIWTGSI